MSDGDQGREPIRGSKKLAPGIHGGEFPPEVEQHARSLCDDDAFIERVCMYLVGYHDQRVHEINGIGLEDAKVYTDRILSDVRRLQGSMALYEGVAFHQTVLNQLDHIGVAYTRHREWLDTFEGRKTKRNSLRWLVAALDHTFQTYGVPGRKLGAFIDTALKKVDPHTPPSTRLIQTTVSKLRT